MQGDIVLICWDCKKIAHTDDEKIRYELFEHWGHSITLIEDWGESDMRTTTLPIMEASA